MYTHLAPGITLRKQSIWKKKRKKKNLDIQSHVNKSEKGHWVLSSRIIRSDYFSHTWGGGDGGENKEIKLKTNV